LSRISASTNASSGKSPSFPQTAKTASKNRKNARRALSVETKIKKRELTLTLSDFVIPLDDVPAEVRSAIKHWSQMVDYWAVDWDFKDDTFHNQWQSYRTRKNPKLDLSVKREYPDPGHYTVVVKVIDILGNDTTKTLTVEIK
jgi:adenine-specific DNA-methyltransferase